MTFCCDGEVGDGGRGGTVSTSLFICVRALLNENLKDIDILSNNDRATI